MRRKPTNRSLGTFKSKRRMTPSVFLKALIMAMDRWVPLLQLLRSLPISSGSKRLVLGSPKSMQLKTKIVIRRLWKKLGHSFRWTKRPNSRCLAMLTLWKGSKFPKESQAPRTKRKIILLLSTELLGRYQWKQRLLPKMSSQDWSLKGWTSWVLFKKTRRCPTWKIEGIKERWKPIKSSKKRKSMSLRSSIDLTVAAKIRCSMKSNSNKLKSSKKMLICSEGIIWREGSLEQELTPS